MLKLVFQLLWTVFSILVYLLGSKITLPFVNGDLIPTNSSFINSRLMQVLTRYSGAQSQYPMNIFMLGLSPYITASFIITIIFALSPYFQRKKKLEDKGFTTRYITRLTILTGIVQALVPLVALIRAYHLDGGIIYTFNLYNSLHLVIFSILTIITLVAGTMITLGISNLITDKGIGNGTSIIIATSIIRRIPDDWLIIQNNYKLWLPLISLLIMMILLLETAVINDKICYPVGKDKLYNLKLPIRINQASSMPLISLSYFFGFGSIMLRYIHNYLFSRAELYRIWYGWLNFKLVIVLSLVLSAVIILIINYLQVKMYFNPEEIAEHLQRPISVLANQLPGEHTVAYLSNLAHKTSILGGLYLVFLYIINQVLSYKYLVPSSFMGVSLLIMIGSIVEIIEKISTQLVTYYQRFIN